MTEKEIFELKFKIKEQEKLIAKLQSSNKKKDLSLKGFELLIKIAVDFIGYALVLIGLKDFAIQNSIIAFWICIAISLIAIIFAFVLNNKWHFLDFKRK